MQGIYYPAERLSASQGLLSVKCVIAVIMKGCNFVQILPLYAYVLYAFNLNTSMPFFFT
jgi:hypothetical protein